MNEPPQFTAGQILEAGSRAEAEGRIEFAVQFYRHLVEHYPGTLEAGAAEHGLLRLNVPQPVPTTSSTRLPPAGWQPDLRHVEPQYGQSLPADPFGAPRPAEPAFTQWPQHQPMPTLAPAPAPLPRVVQRPVVLPPPVRDYRAGRFIGRLVTWLGGALLLAGLVVLPITTFSPRSLSGVPLLGMLVGGPVTGAGILVAGLLQIVLGQLIRAVLEHANAARDLAAIGRAQAEAPPEQAGRPQRR